MLPTFFVYYYFIYYYAPLLTRHVTSYAVLRHAQRLPAYACVAVFMTPPYAFFFSFRCHCRYDAVTDYTCLR